MKQLTDQDIAKMIGTEFTPDDKQTRNRVRSELHLSTRIPNKRPTPSHTTLDLHQLTEEQAWTAIMNVAQSGTRTATIITGASGILRIKFIQWARDSLLTPYLISYTPINNGSFSVKFKKQGK
ncbi:MAG: Smr/MutS family protein [Alphaproteobacteria bacterium]|nr:Smr/MutS family protein [Alphaproteobacteria bacterium]